MMRIYHASVKEQNKQNRGNWQGRERETAEQVRENKNQISKKEENKKRQTGREKRESERERERERVEGNKEKANCDLVCADKTPSVHRTILTQSYRYLARSPSLLSLPFSLSPSLPLSLSLP